MNAFLPYSMIHAAAQFASTDESKQVLTGILVRPAESGGIYIDSTDGTRAFHVACPDTRWECSEPILLQASQFKKKIGHARFIAFDDDTQRMAKILGGKGEAAAHLQSIPWRWHKEGYASDNPAGDYPNIDQLWPSSFTNAPNRPVAFNASLLADFLAIAKLYSWNSVIRMQLNGATNPIVYAADINDKANNFDGVTMHLLLMPVKIRA